MMFWGTLLTSKVAYNFLIECLMTGNVLVICIFHDESGDEMHCQVLNGGIPGCLQLTEIWLFIRPEMYPSN